MLNSPLNLSDAGEEIPADDPDHGEHEDPQQDQEAEPGNGQDEFWQGR